MKGRGSPSCHIVSSQWSVIALTATLKGTAYDKAADWKHLTIMYCVMSFSINRVRVWERKKLPFLMTDSSSNLEWNLYGTWGLTYSHCFLSCFFSPNYQRYNIQCIFILHSRRRYKKVDYAHKQKPKKLTEISNILITVYRIIIHVSPLAEWLVLGWFLDSIPSVEHFRLLTLSPRAQSAPSNQKKL